jgi:hypothetical protein
MKTLKKVILELVYTEHIPEVMEEGKFYYSEEFDISNHLCVCGCKHQVPLPIKKGEWNLSLQSHTFSITPSIKQRFECKSHYIITNGIANIVS